MNVTSVRVEKITYNVNSNLHYAVIPSDTVRSRSVVNSGLDNYTKLSVWINPVPRGSRVGSSLKVKVEKLDQHDEGVGADNSEVVSGLPHNVEFEDVVAYHIGADFSKLLHKCWSFLWIMR